MAGETSLSRHFSSGEPVEQGPGESVLTSSDNILRFKRKVNLLKNHIMKGNPYIFPVLGLQSE
jgi:hypothetical protein